ncbi:MAG: hypothetical protein B5M53_09325 [Candidatus Cloacimonas sp. 4484_209]|nr:MAG: hypothetical protein B5M53_09325 [Candidatus Cloacimonas sp. 4484_209]
MVKDKDRDLEEKIKEIIKRELKKEVPEIDQFKKYENLLKIGMEFLDGIFERMETLRSQRVPQIDIRSLPISERLKLLKGQRINSVPVQRPQIVERVPETAVQTEAKTQDIKEKEVSNMIEKDMQEKIGMAVSFIKNMDNEEFRKKIEEKEDLIGKYKSFLAFLPAHYKGFILNLRMENIKAILKEEAPDKYEILEELQGWEYLQDQFNELKKILGG